MSLNPLSQSHVRVEVDFYDEAERDKLLAYPTRDKIKELVGQPVEVPMAEFLVNYLLHKKRLGTPGFKDRAAIGRKLGNALAHLDGCVDFNGHSICTAEGLTEQLTEVTEHIGESIGLSIVNHIHGLNEADWTPIPQQRGRSAQPTFDFEIALPSVHEKQRISIPMEVDADDNDAFDFPDERRRSLPPDRDFEDDIASDGGALVQLENKGSTALDNRVHSSAVVAQKRRIDQKKAKLQARDEVRPDSPAARTIRYGTIAVLDPRQDGNVRCWLTDPPGDEVQPDPRRVRLLRRLQFMREWISFVSPRAQLASALATRIADLATLRDPFELDRVPLSRASGEPFSADSDFASWSFWANKSAVGASVGGVVVQLNKDALMLLGIRHAVVGLAIEQSFDEVLAYQFEPMTLTDAVVKCVFSDGRFKSLQLPASVAALRNRQGGYSSFDLQGNVHYSPSGVALAVLPLPQE